MARKTPQLTEIVRLVRQLSGDGRTSWRWALALLVALGAYVLLRPSLESSLGIDLPALVDWPPASSDVADAGATREAPPPKVRQPPREPASETAAPRAPERDPAQARSQPAGESTDAELSELMKKVGRDRFESPAGLIYGRGSVHGHRLKHLMAHTHDQPDRPGQHGVFDIADAVDVVTLVDEAYRQALTGRRTDVQREGARTVYTVDLGRRIGYIGGESGDRRNHPAARQIRLVVQGNQFITAFPVRP